MQFRRVPPHPALRNIIRSFGERRAELSARVVAFPLTARPHQIVDIYLGDPLRIRVDGGQLEAAPEMAIVGPQGSRRIHVYSTGTLHIFNILLQPAALHQLFGLDMTEFIGKGIPARDALGKHAAELESAVRSAPDFASRVAAAERWFGNRLERSSPEDGIAQASRHLLTARGNVRISALADHSGLSDRQFQRRFTRQIGLPPKLYARITRFDAVLAEHRSRPEKSWTRIIHEADYFDQAHFIRECHALVGLPPSAFIGDWNNIFMPSDV